MEQISGCRFLLRASVILIAVTLAGLAQIASATELRFVRSEAEVTSVSLANLLSACPAERVRVDDPYHERTMSYFALSFRCVFDAGFAAAGGAEGLREEGLLLRALDGYTRSAALKDLLGGDTWLAFGETALMADAEAVPRFSSIDRRQVDPAPFYLVWSGVNQADSHTHPWPYQLGTIEIASFEDVFPHTVPKDLEESDAGWRGFGIFRDACAACHSMNGEGGKIGPDLNVPTNILEYRPETQVRGYIRDPQKTRYTNMPAHPDLTDTDLDALIAYFEAMRNRKFDPRGSNSDAAKAAEAAEAVEK